MPSPFPGMDPYLEDPELWPDVRHRIISEIQTALNPGLRPHYVARVELRVYRLKGDDPAIELLIPDVRVEETMKVEARHTKTSNGAAIAIAEPEAIPYVFDDDIKEARLEIRRRDSGSLVTIIELLSPANKVRGSRGRISLLEKRENARSSNVHWVEIDLLRGGSPTVAALGPSDYRVVSYRAKKVRGNAGESSSGKRCPRLASRSEARIRTCRSTSARC